MCERGKKDLTIYDTDSYRTVKIYCRATIVNIHEMSAAEFIEEVLERQN
ncbi:hypothetical protein [Bacillus cereus]